MLTGRRGKQNQCRKPAVDPSLAQPQEEHSAAPCPPPGTRGECSGVQGPRQCLRHQPGEDFTKPSCSSPSLATFIAWELATACSRKGVKLMICQFGTPAQPCGGAACRCHTGSTARMRSAIGEPSIAESPGCPGGALFPPQVSPPRARLGTAAKLSAPEIARQAAEKNSGEGERQIKIARNVDCIVTASIKLRHFSLMSQQQ